MTDLEFEALGDALELFKIIEQYHRLPEEFKMAVQILENVLDSDLIVTAIHQRKQLTLGELH